ncbi:MAG: transcription antitermination factor NusB [Treponema sp.]|nr:transcription antitermination factor NusB [Treponema sp.]
MSRRKGRILAFQALYSWDVGGIQVPELVSFSWTENEKGQSSDQESRDFARLLISGAIEHMDTIDAEIKKHLSEKWDFGRLNKVTLAILRMSVYSLLFQKDLPATIVIDEAIDIAKEYGPDDSFKFINALLDTIKKTSSTEGEGDH